ncbi:GrpB family protein [Labedella phragmitis]|uniref:GrpB family protein n=1 Tax=Labedella phragmitis TaxID=2498849 RepID=UPI00140CC26F|nr:GrpB family protein [Labedella phragmitis]
MTGEDRATHPLWRPLVAGANAARQGQRVAHRQTEPGPLQEHDPSWSGAYATVETVIRGALLDRALGIEHVGSTAVPGLVAKPVIDIDLTVADVGDEPAYLPVLERVGFRLIFRDELAGEPHRHLTFPDPNTNLHVWNSGAIEPRRHALFAEHLRSDATGRRRYGAAKLAAAAAREGGRYNDLKAAAVYEIYERAFRADREHDHDPRPLD